ncbi:MAG: lysylphosphatidylglycerol synthase transmembrane domain-containing protein [Anaerovoracaceae bacterium]
MEDNKSKKKIIISGIFFIVIVALTFKMLFGNKDITTIMNTIKDVDHKYLVMGVCSMSLFVLCEGINIKRLVKTLGYECTIFQGLRYSATGFFFSSITPSASGGQPMQLYFMNRDKISISHGTLALIVELASYQLVTLSMAIIAFAFNYSFMENTNPKLKTLLAIGVLLNLLVFIGIMVAMFSKTAAKTIVGFVINILEKLKIKRVDKIRESAYSQIAKYHSGVTIIQENKMMIAKTIMTTVVGISGLHSVTYFVYKAFGLTGYGFLTVFALQAVLYIAVSAIPLPGAVGVSEGGFILLFKTLFPATIINSAVLLSRGISFYLYVVITGLLILVTQCIISAKEKKRHG